MSAGSASDIQDLARAADAAAIGVRPWQIGHELAKTLTDNDRSMTPDEAALVQGLERTMEWSDSGRDRFRVWWLDENTSLEGVHHTWPSVWASIADAAQHPSVVAHLSDLLWVVGHGEPHLHARHAIDAYLTSGTVLDEAHDRCGALFRGLDLARTINDPDRISSANAAAVQAVAAALDEGDIGIAIAVLEHLGSSDRRHVDAEAERADLLRRTWNGVARPDHVERVAKLLLRSAGPSERDEITTRVVESFRTKAAKEEQGFGQLIALRDALRVAEELGHPAHGEILHEIETLDSDQMFVPLRSEHVVSRELASDFCAEIVGDDSLERALGRFAIQLSVTPASVQSVRDATNIGLRHVVTNMRIGEANSIVTSSETADAAVDPLTAALERDILQQVGYHAQMTAFLFLAPGAPSSAGVIPTLDGRRYPEWH